MLEERIRNSYRYITKRMNPDLEDDCVQECLLAFHLNGKGQTVDQAVIDFLRKYGGGGRKGQPGYEAKLNLHRTVEIPNSLSYESETQERLDTSLIDGRLKEIVDLYIEGYSQKEIGYYYGISESRVCQYLTNFTNKMQFITRLPKEVKEWAAYHAL